MEWINELDRELSRFREMEALIYYQADKGHPLDAKALNAIAEERRSLIISPETLTKADALIDNSPDPLTCRKAVLLRRQVLMSHIDDHVELSGLRRELEEIEYEAKDDMGTPEGMRCYLKMTEGCARESIMIANRLARDQGFGNYAEAKLDFEELTMQAFVKTLSNVRGDYELQCRELLGECKAHHVLEKLSQQELDRAAREFAACADDKFPPEKFVPNLEHTLSLFGLDLEELPIAIEFLDLPYQGAVHPLKIGKDIRVVLNAPKGGFDQYAMLVHEIGHALYYLYVPDSVLLLDNRIGREGLADLWAAFVERGEWLRGFGELSDLESNELLRCRDLFHSYMIMTFVRESLFELELYSDPQADFLSVWNAITKECFGFENRTELYSEFVFLYPLDIKDYIYAHIIRKALVCDLEERFGDDLGKPGVLEFLVKNYYEAGNSAPWHERFPLDGIHSAA